MNTQASLQNYVKFNKSYIKAKETLLNAVSLDETSAKDGSLFNSNVFTRKSLISSNLKDF